MSYLKVFSAQATLASIAALRRLLATQGPRVGEIWIAAEETFKMRDVSRHKSMDVLQSYIRDAELFRDHAGAGLL